jgi:hypothetical protein
MEPVVRVDVWVLGPRNYPVGYAKLPATLVADFADLVDGAKRLNPATTPEAVVRAIWRYGSRQLWRNLRHRIPITGQDLPEPKPLGEPDNSPPPTRKGPIAGLCSGPPVAGREEVRGFGQFVDARFSGRF